LEENVLIINDNGFGFSQNQDKNIFKPFHQLFPMGKYLGAGIGLTIVQKIVQKLNITLEVESKNGIGTTFKLIF
jgi:signal transduction histidine kinase